MYFRCCTSALAATCGAAAGQEGCTSLCACAALEVGQQPAHASRLQGMGPAPECPACCKAQGRGVRSSQAPKVPALPRPVTPLSQTKQIRKLELHINKQFLG